MAFFRGVQLGVSSRCETRDEASAGDVAHFFGDNRSVSVPSRWLGRVTLVSGLATAAGAVQLGAALGTLRNLNDGTAGPLVDSLGTTWPQVLMTDFGAPTSRVIQGTDGSYSCGFRCAFLHLQA